MGLFGFGNKKKLDSGLSKTRTGFFGNIVNTLIGSQITDDLYAACSGIGVKLLHLPVKEVLNSFIEHNITAQFSNQFLYLL